MKILAFEKERPGAGPDRFAPHLKDEAWCVWQLYQSGQLREFYFRQDRHEAVLVLECPDPAQAARLVDTLPLVQAGLITFELIPLVPYTGFARLFEEERS